MIKRLLVVILRVGDEGVIAIGSKECLNVDHIGASLHFLVQTA